MASRLVTLLLLGTTLALHRPLPGTTLALRRPLPAWRCSVAPHLALALGPDGLLGDPEMPVPSEKVLAAIEATRGREGAQRLTAADLAAKGGISIDEARIGMKELATALAGADGLSVSASSKGDLLYAFPADVRGELASRSNASKVRDAWNRARPALQTVGRVSFGLALFASIAIIFLAISVLQAETRGSSSDRDEREGGFGGGPLGGFGYGYGYSPLDLFFPRPFGFYGYGWFEPPPRMSLPEGTSTQPVRQAVREACMSARTWTRDAHHPVPCPT